METFRRASRYDLFKLIVALVLLLLFFLLLRRPTDRPFAIAPTLTAIPATTDVNPAVITVSATPRPPTASAGPPITMSPAEATFTPPLAPTSTSSASITSTPTPEPPPAATNLPTLTATAAPSIQPTTTGTSQTSSNPNTCEKAASRSRLQPGMSAVILRRLNFRSSPGIQHNWLRTNIPGTQVQVVGGPECVPHLTGAYIWWQVRLPDGEMGWSAEGSIHGAFYFMEPVE